MKRPRNKFWLLVAHVKYFLKRSRLNNIPALSGRSAFFLILSIIPFIMFVYAVTVLLGHDPTPEKFVSMFQVEMDPKVYDLIVYVYNAARQSSSGFVIITIIVALWSAGNGLYTITEGVSRVYRLRDTRFWFFKRVFAMGYTVVILLLLSLAAGVLLLDMMFTELVQQVFDNVFVSLFINILQYFLFKMLELMFLLVTLKLFLRRRIKNKRYRSFRALLPGMLLVTIAWDFLTWGVSIYIRYFAQNSLYGSLGTAVIIMMWIYFAVYIFLWGIQFNCLYRMRLYDIRLKPKRSRKKKTDNS